MTAQSRLTVSNMEIKQVSGMYFVRISIGDSMYFDTPNTFKDNATLIYNSLLRRLS